MTTRPPPACLLPFLKSAEACPLKAYQDSGGIWTIALGHTGPEVVSGLVWTQAQADAQAAIDIQAAADRLASRIGLDVIVDLTDNQYAALISFVFNLGADPGWTIWKVLKARQFDQVPAQMIRFVYCGGKKLTGLVNRRNAEIALWSTAEPGSADEAPSSAVTRQEATPPAALDPKPALQSHSLVTAGAAAVTTATVAIGQVSQAVQPYAAAAPLIGQLVAGLALVSAALAVAALIFVWLKRRQANS